jgi:hypothetical protein
MLGMEIEMKRTVERLWDSFMEKIKQNIVWLLVVFAIGNIVGTGTAYNNIQADCSIIKTFRVGSTVYSCEKK